MKDTVLISLTDLLNGSLEMGSDDYIPPQYYVSCEECGKSIKEIEGDDTRKIICNKCYFSFEENK